MSYVARKGFNFFVHPFDLRKDARIGVVVGRYGAKGYGVLMAMYEKMSASPAFEMEFRYEEYEFVDLGLSAGDRIYFDELVAYAMQQKALKADNFSPVYTVFTSDILVDLMKHKITESQRRAIKKHETDKEIEKHLRKRLPKKLVEAKELASQSRRLNKLKGFFELSPTEVARIEAAFPGHDVKSALRFFREEYILNPMNVDLYLNAASQERAVSLFVEFMHSHVLTPEDRKQISDSIAMTRKVETLKNFKPSL